MKKKGEDKIRAAIENAENAPDPLDGLVDKAKGDQAAPFAPDVIEALAFLKVEKPQAFERIRLDLKNAGVRVTELDKAIKQSDDRDTGSRGTSKRGSQADQLIEIAQAAKLFHAPDDRAYAAMEINGHREIRAVRSNAFKQWLAHEFFQETGGGAGSEAFSTALTAIEARARYEGDEIDVHLRVADTGSHQVIDLADEHWRAVEIGPNGWQIVAQPKVMFRRTPGMRPIPLPVRNGKIDDLRPFLNVADNDDFVLLVCWILAALRATGPFPVLVLMGEQGSAKSTFSEVLKRILDPSGAPRRGLPRNEQDLFISAQNAHVLAFDNVSGIPGFLSDALCRLATGGGHAARLLWTNEDEAVIDAVRPVILNGIGSIVTRADLADRAIFLRLPTIPEDQRRPEGEFMRALEAALPRILGAVYDALAHGLRMLPKTNLHGYPRMADFALLGTACEAAFAEPGTFTRAYGRNRDTAIEAVIDTDAVAAAVRDLVMDVAEWQGTATELLVELRKRLPEGMPKGGGLPTTPQHLSGRLHRAVPFLRHLGIVIEFSREGRARDRMISITRP